MQKQIWARKPGDHGKPGEIPKILHIWDEGQLYLDLKEKGGSN